MSEVQTKLAEAERTAVMLSHLAAVVPGRVLEAVEHDAVVRWTGLQNEKRQSISGRAPAGGEARNEGVRGVGVGWWGEANGERASRPTANAVRIDAKETCR